MPVQNTKKKVTMRQIAEAVGVSTVTVSNALAGKAGVSSEVRSRILEKAARLGYDPGEREKRSSSKTITLGVISSNMYMSEKTSFYWEMYQSVVNACFGKNILTMLEVFDERKGSVQEPTLLSREQIDGFFIIGRVPDVCMRQILRKRRGPIVLLDFDRPGYQCDSVLSDNYTGMYRATKYLAERGHRQIGFVGSVRTSANVLERYYGYWKCMREYGITPDPEWLLEDRDVRTEDAGEIRLPGRLPSAFACSSDYSAGFLYNALRKRGLRVPEDISVIGYDDYLYGNDFADRLTTYHVDFDRMAEKAVELMQRRIMAPMLPHVTHYIDSYIVERSSVSKAGGGAGR